MNWFQKIANFNIQTPQGPAELIFTDEGAQFRVRFSYQHDDGLTEYLVTGLSLHQPGMYPPVGRPSYVLIQKSQLSSESPIDDQFISSLTSSLKLTPVEWSAGSNPMITMLNNVTGKRYTDDPNDVNMTEFEDTEVLPLPSGISVSKVEGAWSVIYAAPSESVTYYIKTIVNAMKATVQPMMESGLLDFYEISDSTIVPNEMVRSQRGQESWDQSEQNNQLHIGYYKYILQKVLQPYPTLLKLMLEKVIPWGWTGNADIPPSPKQVDLRQSEIISGMIDNFPAEMAKYIHDAVLNFDDNSLGRLELLVQQSEQSNISLDIISSILYWFSSDDFETLVVENMKNGNLMYWYSNYFTPEIRQLFNATGYSRQIESVYAAASEGAMRALQNQDIYSVKKFWKFYRQLDLPPEAVQAYEQVGQRVNEEEIQRHQERAQAERNARLTINWNTAIYNLPADEGFTDIKEESLGYYIADNFRDYEFGEELYYDAQERASEEAYSNIPARESEVYPSDVQGNFDENELLTDIRYEWDEFLSETDYYETLEGNAFWSKIEHLPKEKQEELMVKMIIEELRQEFIDWKREQFKIEEEGESWKYDPEPDEEDIWKIMRDIADDIAFREGVLHAEMNWDQNRLDLYVHSKYRDQAIALVKEIAKVNQRDNEEFGLNSSTVIEIDYVDTETTDRFTVYQLTGKMASSWFQRIVRGAVG